MDLSSGKPCIISVGIGAGYAAGIDRLAQSLQWHGYLGDTMFWKDYPSSTLRPHTEDEGQYNFKIAAFQEAFLKGYNVVLWLDASLYAIQDPMPMFDYINDNGIFLFKSGYPLSATATDKLLSFHNVQREDLFDTPEFATGAVGINIRNPNGSAFFRDWKYDCLHGMFGGSRNHNSNDSIHPSFKFSRQDQSSASAVLHKMGITTSGEDKNWVSYYPNKTESTIFFVKGV